MYVCHCHHPALHIPCVRSLTLTYITPHTQRHDDMIILLDDEPTTLPNAAPTLTGDSAAAAASVSDELPTVINGSPCDEGEEVMATPSAPQVPAEPEVVEAKPTSTNPTQALLRRKTCLADTSLHLVRSKSFTGTGGRDVLRAMLRANSTRERTMRAVRETSHSSASAWAEQRALTDQKLRIQRARAAQQQQQQLRLAQLQDTAGNPFEPPPSAAAPAGPDSSEEGAAEAAAAPGAVESGQDSTLLASQATAATAEFAVHSSDEDEEMPDAEGEGSQRLQRKAQPTQSEALLESSDDEGSGAVSAADAEAVAAAKAEAAKRRQEERERAEVAAGLGPKLAIGADGAIKGSKKTQSLASLFGAVAKKQAATGQPALSAAQAMQKKPARSTGRIGALLASGTSKKRAHADSNASDSEEGASPTKRTRRPGGADGSEADDEGEAESSSEEEEESGPTEEELAAEAARKAKRDKDKAAGYRRMLLEEAKQSAAHKRSSVSQSP